MKRMKIIIAVAAVTAVLAGGGYYYMSAQAVHNIEPAAGGHMQMPPPAVSVLTIEPRDITLTRSLPGRISALRQSQVRPQVNGIITERLFEEGALVEKGQQLYQIDDARYNAALNSAKADLKSAQSTIASIQAKANRYAELVKIDAVSRQEYDDVRAQLDQARAAVEVAKAAVAVAQVNLDYTKVYAPIDGRIGRSFVTEGTLVTANQPESMAVITQLDQVYVDMQQASIEALELRRAHAGRGEDIPVTLMLGEGGKIAYPHKGSLQFSEVTIDETTGSVTLRAVVPNPDDLLLPGLFVRATLEGGHKQALLVPQRATTRGPDGSLSVWILDGEDKAQPRKIETSGAYEASWIVTGGVNAGDRVIVEGYQKVAPDMVAIPSPWMDGNNPVSAQAASGAQE